MQGVDFKALAEMFGGTPEKRALDQVTKGNLPELCPMDLPCPPLELSQAIDQARTISRRGDANAARLAFESNVEQTDVRKALGAYRERLSYAEAVNARKLVTLCWTHAELLRYDEPGMRSLATMLEGIAYDYFGLTELSTARGWADKVCQRLDILPVAWRHA